MRLKENLFDIHLLKVLITQSTSLSRICLRCGLRIYIFLTDSKLLWALIKPNEKIIVFRVKITRNYVVRGSFFNLYVYLLIFVQVTNYGINENFDQLTASLT